MPKFDGLSPKEQLFVKEYLIDLNIAAAAKRTGYSEKTAAVQGHQIINRPKVAKAIQEAMDARSEKVGITAETVLKRLDDIGDLDIADAYDENGRLLPVHKMPIHVRKSISSIKVFEEFEGFGQDRIKVGEVREVKFWPKVQSNELIGKHINMFTEKVEIKHTVKTEALSDEELDAAIKAKLKSAL